MKAKLFRDGQLVGFVRFPYRKSAPTAAIIVNKSVFAHRKGGEDCTPRICCFDQVWTYTARIEDVTMIPKTK